MKWFSLLHCCLAAVIATLFACTKTTGPDPLPQNRILSFKVVNLTDTVIYGAIDDIDNTITVYIPFYYGLTVIDPRIEVSGGAKLQEEILPVAIDGTASYTVTGADGSKRNYSLSIVLQNTPPLQADWANPNLLAYPRSSLPAVKGNFWARNRELLKLTLRNEKTGKTVLLDPGTGHMQINAQDEYSFGNVAIPATIDTGTYKLELGFMGHQVVLEQPVHIVHRQPNVIVLSRVAKQGETITFTANSTTVLLELNAVSVELNGVAYPLPVVSFTPLEMVLKIPDDFPVGEYSFVPFTFQFTGWNNVTKYGSLTVNPK
jgi:hypothetical protein